MAGALMISEKIFREYDVRGIVGKDIDNDVALSLGKAFAVFLKQTNQSATRVSVGRDVRLSSEGLAAAVMEGMRQEGLNVVDIGVCPTPLQYFSIFHLGLDGGIMVTGSHNPPEYNGFKISVGRETIHGRDIQALKEIILAGQWSAVAEKGSVSQYGIIDAYREYMLKEFSYLNGQDFRRLKIVVDAGNGTAGPIAPDILSRIGCDVIQLYCEPDGNFPNHHPDPTVVEYIRDLIAATKDSGADMGVGYDGDSDRIGVVNSAGDVVWGDQIMIILGREVLKEHPGTTIIGDVKCSQLMFDAIAAGGGIPLMWKTGHSLIKQKMRDEKALLAGEFSGHIFIGDRYFGYDDALYTTFRLVEIMKKTGKDIRELLSDIPRLYYTPEIRVDCSDDRKKAAVEKIVDRIISYQENGGSSCRIVGVDTTDGVRIVFESGWGLVRSSNTQPVVVMRVEANSQEALVKYRTFLEDEFKMAMLQVLGN
jgi:phosphomannomutase / phosphoglucomutase